MPACWIGTVHPTSFVNRVVSIVAPFRFGATVCGKTRGPNRGIGEGPDYDIWDFQYGSTSATRRGVERGRSHRRSARFILFGTLTDGARTGRSPVLVRVVTASVLFRDTSVVSARCSLPCA